MKPRLTTIIGPPDSRCWSALAKLRGLTRLFSGFILISFLLSFSLPAAAAEGKYFLVQRLTGQEFRVEPQVPGPVATSLAGGSPYQQLITRQEQGRIVILASLSPGSTLLVRAGQHRLALWVTNPPGPYFHEAED